MDPSRAEPAALHSVLQCVDLRVTFGSLAAVDGISLVLRGGDLLGLIGPNGAGKTTLLRAIAGLQELTSGHVQVLDEAIRPGGAIMQQIGFTPDTPSAYEDLTVRQFLQFIGRGYNLSGGETDERIDFWLEKVWLSEKSQQKIKQLSRGMRQRLGLARTLLPNPSLVLLDEPAAGLDPAGRVQFRQLLCDLRDQGKALIVSSHILSDMNEYCTHIAIQDRGRLMKIGTVHEVSNHESQTHARYQLMLARPMVDLADVVARIADARLIEHDRLRVTIEFTPGPESAAALLQMLVSSRVPVASFVELRPDLEQVYLRAGVAQVE